MSQNFEKIEKITAPALDKILGKPFKVLNDGFIRVVDYLGSDDSIVQAARVSYGKGTKKVSEDRGLIRYLLRHRHTTPRITFFITRSFQSPLRNGCLQADRFTSHRQPRR